MYLVDQGIGAAVDAGKSLATGILSIPGVSPYYSPEVGGIVWRLRTPEMLRKVAKLYSGVPILDEHPETLAPRYPRASVVGGVVSATYCDEADGILADLILHDYPTVADRRYFSHGVRADLVPIAGVWRGIAYDEIIDITDVNHVCSTTSPRQGTGVRLLDSLKGMNGGRTPAADFEMDPKTIAREFAIVLPGKMAARSSIIEDKQISGDSPLPEIPTPMDTEITDPTDEAIEIPREVYTSIAKEVEQILGPLRLAIEAITELATSAGLTKGLTEDPIEDPTEELPETEDLRQPESFEATLADALFLQSEAIALGVEVQALSDATTWEATIASAEKAVGLSDSWDPTGLTISQRLRVVSAIRGSLRPPKVLADSLPVLPLVPPPPKRAGDNELAGGMKRPLLPRFV
jgi:hypothetical protein